MFAYFHMCLYPSNKIINFFIHENVLDAVKGTVTEVSTCKGRFKNYVQINLTWQ